MGGVRSVQGGLLFLILWPWNRWTTYCQDLFLPSSDNFHHAQLGSVNQFPVMQKSQTAAILDSPAVRNQTFRSEQLWRDVEDDGQHEVLSTASFHLRKQKSRNASLNMSALMRTEDTSSIFTISPVSNPNLCLDMAQGHGVSIIQIWQCNGHENQLWYFDSGSYKITWGGDRSQCIDAGSPMAPGTQLFLWQCNALPQQQWGYDENAQTIYLSDSMSNAKYCMDLSGGSLQLGTAVQVWDCNGLPQQQWNLLIGITIRSYAGYTFCMDLEGGKTDNGTPLQLWDCNGLANQKWVFENYNIKPITDPNKCVDSGNPATLGEALYIWDCNGLPQQQFGYDAGMNTIYFSASMDAALCVDIKGGQLQQGTKITVWECNSCWNQQFSVVGPVITKGAQRELWQGAATHNSSLYPWLSRRSGNTSAREVNSTDGCPARPPCPAPSPAPGPSPAPYILPHCMGGSQYNWPSFDSQSQMQASNWAKYFELVYGEVPSTGYPICLFGLSLLYPSLLAQAQVSVPAPSTSCPNTAGQYYGRMSGFNTDTTWIYNPVLAHPEATSVPGNKWVEVLHSQFTMDGDATWFYYAPGSGIFMWTGNTKVYTDHNDATKDLLHKSCTDKFHECQKQFSALYRAAIAAGYETLQFLRHSDMQCDPQNHMMNLAIEIVDLKGPGTTTCSQANSGDTRFRAGWEAKSVCNCDNAQKVINCKGFALSR